MSKLKYILTSILLLGRIQKIKYSFYWFRKIIDDFFLFEHRFSEKQQLHRLSEPNINVYTLCSCRFFFIHWFVRMWINITNTKLYACIYLIRHLSHIFFDIKFWVFMYTVQHFENKYVYIQIPAEPNVSLRSVFFPLTALFFLPKTCRIKLCLIVSLYYQIEWKTFFPCVYHSHSYTTVTPILYVEHR